MGLQERRVLRRTLLGGWAVGYLGVSIGSLILVETTEVPVRLLTAGMVLWILLPIFLFEAS